MRFCLLALVAFCFSVSPLLAQRERYELGQRLIQFEKTWDRVTDAKLRQKSTKDLPSVTRQFFSFQFGEAGRTLDEARFALESTQPVPDDVRWLTALYPDVSPRLVDASAKALSVTMRPFYTVKTDKPKEAKLKFRIGNSQVIEAAVDKLPIKVEVPIPPLAADKTGVDYSLTVETWIEGKKVFERSLTVSVIRGATETFPAAKKLASETKAVRQLDSWERSTVIERMSWLDQLASGNVLETDYPAAKLWDEAQVLAKSVQDKNPYYSAKRAGEFWLSIPTGDDQTRSVTHARIWVPKDLTADKPVPLVVALHGAGGSENLFFEGYGAGHIVQECQKRGWLLIATRSGLAFGGGAPPVGEIVAALAKIYPVDPKQVFLVGHSMGASQAIEVAQKYPGQFRAVAALGGSGRVRDAKAFAELPVFVGVGEQDFALSGAKALRAALKSDTKLLYKEYPHIEHLLIVREALPDVFAEWDRMK